MEVLQSAEGMLEVRGDRDHPANQGRLCSKGAALADTLASDRNRLLRPRVDGAEVSWDTALEAVAGRWRGIIDEHGSDAVAFYASGQMLTEDYYVANKLMKGFIGTGNIDTNSRLCMSSAVTGQVRAFGADTVACSYQDLEDTELLILVGSNLAWCHPVLYQRVKRARLARDDMRVVVIDPRRTESCEIADLHLPIAPDADVSLFNGLLRLLHQGGGTDAAFIAAHTEGFEQVLAALPDRTVPELAADCGLAVADVQQLLDWIDAADSTVSAFSMGVNQSRSGTDKVNAIINLHLALGRIGKPGCGPFSITGQPNAMGGREVGGLATTLAAHMGFSDEDCDRVQRFWNSPRIARAPGLKALELFEAIDSGAVKSVWIMATNPLFSLPDAERWRRALARCECVIVSDCVDDTDTLAAADICLPALGWGEKTGTVTNSERCLSRQRAFLPAPGEARPDWWAICEVAGRLGFSEGFNYSDVAEVFAEHARLSGFENRRRRDFDISALGELAVPDYHSMAPVRWPLADGQASPEVFRDGRFYHADGRARFVPVTGSVPGNKGLILNTGRVRDHWHSMTRTGRAERLCDHTPEPRMAVHPEDLMALGLSDGGLARIESPQGMALLRVRRSEAQALGQVFVPMHWSRRFSSAASINSVVAPAADPLSGEPAFKLTDVQITPVETAWSGVFAGFSGNVPPTGYWVRVPGAEYERLLLMAEPGTTSPEAVAECLLPASGRRLQLADTALGLYRWAVLDENGALLAALSIGPREIDADQTWLTRLFQRPTLSAAEQQWLLAGMTPDGAGGQGRLVCSCNRVGETVIRELVRAGCDSPAALTERCAAGGGCGSCLPELQTIIDEEQRACRIAS